MYHNKHHGHRDLCPGTYNNQKPVSNFLSVFCLIVYDVCPHIQSRLELVNGKMRNFCFAKQKDGSSVTHIHHLIAFKILILNEDENLEIYTTVLYITNQKSK